MAGLKNVMEYSASRLSPGARPAPLRPPPARKFRYRPTSQKVAVPNNPPTSSKIPCHSSPPIRLLAFSFQKKRTFALYFHREIAVLNQCFYWFPFIPWRGYYFPRMNLVFSLQDKRFILRVEKTNHLKGSVLTKGNFNCHLSPLSFPSWTLPSAYNLFRQTMAIHAASQKQ